MTLFDLIIILIFLASTLLATVRGAVLELGTLLALGIAILLALQFANPIVTAMGNGDSIIATALTYGVLIAILFIAIYTVTHILIYKYPFSEKGTLINKIAGGVFGFARAYAVIGLGFLAYGYYLDENDQHDSVRDALTRPIAQSGAQFFEKFIPESAQLQPDQPVEQTDAAYQGYDRRDRAGLSEVISTVTTSDGISPSDGRTIALETQPITQPITNEREN